MTLKTRINLIAVLVTLLVSATLVITGELSLRETQHHLDQEKIRGATTLWKKIISAQLEQMLSGSKALARDRDTLKAIRTGNHEEIEDSARSSYNLLSTQGILDELTIIDKSGNILYSSREHPVALSSDSLVFTALAEKKPKKGIERTADGKLMATVAFPLYYRGKPLGAGVYEKTLEDAIADFKQNNQSEVTIANINNEVVYSTNSELVAQLHPEALSPDHPETLTMPLDNNAYSVVVAPIRNQAGSTIGQLISISDITDSYHHIRTIKLVSFSVAALVLLASIIGLSLYLRSAFKPVSNVIEIVNRVASGDLEEAPAMCGKKDETGELARAVTRMHRMLSKIVTDVRIGATEIANVSAEMAENNTALAQRTEVQASNLEKTSASMEEITSAGKQNAENAALAAVKADEAMQYAEAGATRLEKTIDAVKEIEKSSMEIADIVSLIDEIAFQTNLLALNASVEAARAGEQGKGFSVVATEVRNLAERSANAAREVKELIDASIEKVNQGAHLATSSGQSLEQIVGSVKEVATIIKGIADSSQEQANGVEHINKALSEIDSAVQHNTALVEETAVSSEMMLEQARQLNKLMEFFKLGKVDIASNRKSKQEKRPDQAEPVATIQRSFPEKPRHDTDEKPAAVVAYQKTGTDDWDEF